MVASEVERRREDLQSLAAERARLNAAAAQASERCDTCRAALEHAINDADAAVDMGPQDLERLKREYEASRLARDKTVSGVMAFDERHGDLTAQLKQLTLEEIYAAQQQAVAEFRAVVAEAAVHGQRFAAGLAEIERRIVEAQKWKTEETLPDGRVIRLGAGIPKTLGFPVGIFLLPPSRPAEAPPLARSIWMDHFVRGVAEFDASLLPEEIRQPTLQKIATDKQRQAPRWFARPVLLWDVFPALRQ